MHWLKPHHWMDWLSATPRRKRRQGTASRRNGRPGSTRLRLEPLESRQMLAVLGLEMHLYEDNNGVPGAEIVDDTIEAGETFFVEITAEDLRSDPLGVGGVSITLDWDPAVLEEIDLFDPADPSSPLVTSDFPLIREGVLDNSTGTIEYLRGLALPNGGAGQAIGISGPQRLNLLHFRAEATADQMPLELGIGKGGIGMVWGMPLTSGDLVIESQTITVVESTGPAEIELAVMPGFGEDTIQFTTDLGEYREGEETSPLVRPAMPDTEKYFDVTNTGGSTLTVFEIEVAAPDVTVAPELTDGVADDVALEPGQTQRFHLTYAPTLPTLEDETTQWIDMPEGLVVLSDAANAPELPVHLVGASTFISDIDYNGVVDTGDSLTLGANLGDALGYDPTADVNGDGVIDLVDIGPLSVELGRTLAVAPPIVSAIEEESPSEVAPVFAEPAATEWEPSPVDEEVIAAVANSWFDTSEDDSDEEPLAPPAVEPALILD